MIDKFVFINDHWTWPIIFGAAIIMLVFLWKEWSQSGKPRFSIKAVLAFLAIVSLALIALKPAVPEFNESGKMAVLTKAYDQNQLDSLREAHKNIKVVNYKVNEPLFKEVGSPNSVFVLGHGLKAFDFWQLEDIPVKYLGGSSPDGIIKLKYERENTVGEELILEGLYKNPKNTNRLVLKGPGGASLDSVALNSEENQTFQLATNLNVKGKFRYSLVEKDSLGKILSSEPVPLKIRERDLLKVLVINAFPTFETKYLKNYLAEAGHQVLVRSRITIGRYKFEYFNMERIPLGAFTENNIESFDVLIIDTNSLNNLPTGERGILESTVREKGLGVFVQPGFEFFRSSENFSSLAFNGGNNTTISLNEWPNISLSKYPFLLENEFGLQAIHTSDNSIFSGYKRMGEGRIGTTVFNNTYQLVLKGDTTAYKELWSGIIENVSKRNSPIAEWKPNSLIVYQNQPFEFQLRTAIDEPTVVNNDKISIPLARDIEIPNLWKGVSYPRQTGWDKHVMQQDTTQVFDFYVTDASSWQSLTAQQTMNENTRYFDGQIAAGTENEILKPINPLWFFLVFLVCVGWLWLEPKLEG